MRGAVAAVTRHGVPICYGIAAGAVALAFAAGHAKARKKFQGRRTPMLRRAVKVGSVSTGQRVKWSGFWGVVKFVGEVKFASGTWIGIELDEPQGLHNGTVFRDSYYTCKKKHGVFCQATDLQQVEGQEAVAPAAVAAAPTPAIAGTPAGAVAVGQKVSWKGNAGTVKFVGKVAFANEEMVGVELDEAKGMHNGSLFGESYFSCADKHGVFCKAGELSGSSAAAPAPAAPVDAPVAASPTPAPAAPAPAVASATTGGASVGQKVSWKGNAGTVRFVGKVAFANEEMVGVELDTAKGMHNGSLFGKTYFSCQDKHGVFCKVSELGSSSAPTPAVSAPAPAVPVAAPPAPAPAPVKAPAAPAPVSSAPSAGGVSVGQKVSWKGNAGTVKFVGKVAFANEEMVGVELDAAKGMHNGSLFGQTYFSCEDKHGVFCKASELGGSSAPAPAPAVAVSAPAPTPPAPVAPPTPAPAPVVSTPAPVTSGPSSSGISVGQKVSWKGNAGTVKFVGKVDFAAEEMVGVELDAATGMHNGSLFGKTYFTCQEKHGVFCKASELGASSAPASSPAPAAAAPAPTLAPVVAPPAPKPAVSMPVSSAPSTSGVSVGQKVSWKGNSGTVKFVGKVDFAAEEMVGVELDGAHGMHNGSLFGKTYFSCQDKHGVFCKAAELGGSSAPAPAAPSAVAVAPPAPAVATPPPAPAPTPAPAVSRPAPVASSPSTSGLSVGQKVSWKGNSGTVKFVGKVDFAAEEMVGVELDGAKGMHNGSLFGKTYFSCQDKHGVFCKATELGGSSAPAPVAAAPAPAVATPPAAVPTPAPAVSRPAPVASAPSTSGLGVGQKVTWKGNTGTVKFVGKVDFAAEEMVGVELDAAKGLHNGSLFGKTYFTCQDKHGVFCKVAELSGSSAPAPAPAAAPAQTPAPAAAPPAPAPVAAAPAPSIPVPVSSGGLSIGQKVSWKGNAGTVKFVGKVDFAAEEMVGLELDGAHGLHNGSLFGKTYFTCKDKHGVFCKVSELAGGSATPAGKVPAMAGGAPPLAPAAPAVAAPVAAAPAPAAMPASAPAAATSISVGQKVSWKGNPGTVKFVGKVDFATEQMVGVELDAAKGMHDGSLFGKTYFSCQDKHGVFCKASELGGGGSPAAPAPVAAATPPPAPAAAPAPPAPAPAAPVSTPSAPPPPPMPTGSAAPPPGGYAVGQKVFWKGHAGTVQYKGPVEFSAGDWVGIVLEAAKGLHDGSVFGKSYFTCPMGYGILTQDRDLRVA